MSSAIFNDLLFGGNPLVRDCSQFPQRLVVRCNRVDQGRPVRPIDARDPFQGCVSGDPDDPSGGSGKGEPLRGGERPRQGVGEARSPLGAGCHQHPLELHGLPKVPPRAALLGGAPLRTRPSLGVGPRQEGVSGSEVRGELRHHA